MPYAFTNWSLLSDHLPVYFLCFGACSVHALLEWLSPKNCSLQPGFPLSLVWALSAQCGAPWVCVVTISEIPAIWAHSKNNLAPMDRVGERDRNFSWVKWFNSFCTICQAGCTERNSLHAWVVDFCGHLWFAVTEEFQSPIPTFYDSEGHTEKGGGTCRNRACGLL